MEENNIETLLKAEDKPEVEKITSLLKSMDSSVQNKMLIFIQGAKFAEGFAESKNN